MSDNDTTMTEPMSKEEMIDILKGLVFGTFDRTTAKEREALDMAIKVSEQEPKTGYWIAFDDRYNKCSKCGFHYDTWNNRTEGLPIIFNYCPNCGMKMQEVEE